MKKSFFVYLFLLLNCHPAFSAYRVYQLRWDLQLPNGKVKKGKPFLTTLAPAQYRAYYGEPKRSELKFISTWYCAGDTSQRRPYCPAPASNLQVDPSARVFR